MIRTRTIASTLAAMILAASGGVAHGQSSSLLKPKPEPTTKDLAKNHKKKRKTISALKASWIAVELPEARTVTKHDILTVLIDEKALVSMEDEYTREQTTKLKSKLDNWEWLARGFETTGQPLIRDPQLDGNLSLDSERDATLDKTSKVVARMAVEVTDVKPNGTLVIEGTRTIIIDQVTVTFELTGLVRQDDLLPDNTVLSEDIHNLLFRKTDTGKLREATRRGWFTRLLDFLNPF